jgi:universal stress protein A|tara:strand:- start:803 stop:1231 length:429 start_codon:yes stop_codon:yes gene_type:complete
MPSYKSILIAVDLSDESEQVIKQSLQLYPNLQSKVHLIHTAEQPVTGYGELIGKNHCASENQIRQEIYPTLKQLSEKYGIPCKNLHIKFGSPADTIHEFAEQIEADLIVSGSHGKHGIQLLLGSTANSIIHGAQCDVLTVRL